MDIFKRERKRVASLTPEEQLAELDAFAKRMAAGLLEFTLEIVLFIVLIV